MKSGYLATGIVLGMLGLAACDRSDRVNEGPTLADGKLWAADACKTLPAGAATRVAGVQVRSALPGARSTVGGTQVSTCNYQTSGNGSFTVLMRHQGEAGGGIRQAIAGLRAMPDITGPVTEVPVANGKAFWVQRHRTLSYIPDDKRVVVVTPPNAAGVTDDVLKQTALAIARAAAARQPGRSGG